MSPDDQAPRNWLHVLWNCVGGGDQQAHPEVIHSQLQLDDTLILCSDGLSGVIDDSRISAIVAAASTIQSATQKLIDAANQEEGNDNISAIVCRVNHVQVCDETR